MGAGPFTRTTFNPGAAPGISAERLNEMQQAHEWSVNHGFTTLERDALAGAELWTGRVIYNLDKSRLEHYNGAWSTLPPLTTAGDLMVHDGTNDVRLPIGTAGQALQVNAGATAPVWADAGGGPTLVRKTADESVANTTTLQNDDHLLYALAASEEVLFECTLFAVGSNATSGGLKAAFTVPSGTSIRWAPIHRVDAGVVKPAAAVAASGTSSELANNGDVGVAPGRMFVLRGWAKAGTTAGDLQLQWAPIQLDGDTMTFKQGSRLIVHTV